MKRGFAQYFARLCCVSALTHLGTPPMNQELTRIRHYLGWILAEGQSSESGRASSAHHYRVILRDIEALRQRGLSPADSSDLDTALTDLRESIYGPRRFSSQ